MTSFRARARALDMLGRQQIRGPGTALSELFKNAHDAYATEVRGDLLRASSALVVRDDGVGMTQDDFVERWLTLGTESRLAPPRSTPGGLPARAMLGEKGIGRLAVAVLAHQALILTRARVDSESCTAAFINWDLFAIPGLNLEQIDVAVRKFDGPLPSSEDLRALLDLAVEGVNRLKLPDERRTPLVDAIRSFPLDIVGRSNRLPGPKLGRGGTQFFLAPVGDGVYEALEAEGGDDPDLVRDLIGFANTIVGKPVIASAFWDHRGPDDVRELIGSDEFWTAQELHDADHEVNGRFDEFGTFHGRVRVYERETGYQYGRSGVPARLRAGEFAIHFGYLQGRQSQSRLAPDLYQRLEAKAARIAGLYVYRDGIRVQPYGDHSYDWLDIEKNRSKKASYYFFSYRRMFGYVALDRAHNSALSEKAGREGFRETAAFREFRDLLKAFFVDLAASFFRDGGDQAEYFRQRRDELKRAELVRRARERRNAAERATLGRQLARAADALQRGRPRDEVGRVLKRYMEAISAGPPRSVIAGGMANALTSLAAIRDGVRVALPAVGLPEELRLDWDSYRRDLMALDELVAQAQAALRAGAAAALERAPSTLGLDNDGPQSAAEIDDIVLDQVQAAQRQRVEAAAGDLRKAAADFTDRVDAIIAELTELPSAPDADIARELANVTAAADEHVALLEGLASHVARVELLTSEDGERLSSAELEAAADTELIDLREQIDRDLELAQVGLAIEVVSHEFRQTVFRIRSGLDRLAIWGRRTPDLAALQHELASSFEHLDNYLTLLTPLQRRIRVQPTTLSGREIRRFLGALFDDQLGNGKATLEATPAFKAYAFMGKPAVFYPAFINLVDNALYWAKQGSRAPLVRLDQEGEKLIVEDSGAGVGSRDRDRIFDPGFSRKPAGRGLGLYITRQVLSRNGFELTVGTSKLGGALFAMRPESAEGDP